MNELEELLTGVWPLPPAHIKPTHFIVVVLGGVEKVFASIFDNCPDPHDFRLSSRINGVTVLNDLVVISTESGSLYECRTDSWGMSDYAAGEWAKIEMGIAARGENAEVFQNLEVFLKDWNDRALAERMEVAAMTGEESPEWDFANGQIGRAEAVALLGEELVDRLEANRWRSRMGPLA